MKLKQSTSKVPHREEIKGAFSQPRKIGFSFKVDSLIKSFPKFKLNYTLPSNSLLTPNNQTANNDTFVVRPTAKFLF